jgi:hypothetical protein
MLKPKGMCGLKLLWRLRQIREKQIPQKEKEKVCPWICYVV